MALCDDCRAIDLFRVWQQMCSRIHDGSYDDQTAIMTLKDNVRTLQLSSSSCTLCHILFATLMSAPASQDHDPSAPVVLMFPRGDFLNSTNRLPSDSFPDQIHSLESIYIKREKDSIRAASLHMARDSALDIPPIICGRLPQENDRYKFIRAWNQRCREEHLPCSRVAETSGSPARMLHIRRLSGEAFPHARVVTAPKDDEFVSLSHCWGQQSIIRLLRKTYHEYIRRIPWDELSLTFRNAIEITLELGFEYLWIDSLCIIQDDPSDWEREAAVMGSVYALAALNIMASASWDGSGGCLPARLITSDKTCTLPLQDSGLRHLGEVTVLPISSTLINIETEALSTRGWVLQERMLSRRKIYCTANQFIWSCCDALSPETSLINGSFEIRQSDDKLFYDVLDDLHRSGHAQKFLWADILRSFSSRSLTYEKDKLPALSGLAQIVVKRTGWKYVAGLWQDWLPEGLLWYVLEPPSKRPDIYLGPSWSWVSVNAPIIMDYGLLNDPRFESALEDLRVEVGLTGRYSFGRVNSAALHAQGRIKSATLGEYDRSSNTAWSASRLYDGNDHIGTGHPDGDPQVRRQCHCLYLGSMGFEDMLDDDDDGESNLKDYLDDLDVGRTHYFLMLESTSELDTYRRIGQGRLKPEYRDWFNGADKKAVTLV